MTPHDKPALLVLAAGMGSRYGGLKQLDPMGPAGETLLDYSVFDALRAGFGKVVFVIRKDFAPEFRARIGARYETRVEVAYAFQELDRLPAGFTVPAGREKPWGTTHAIWCAREALNGPFAAVNADDFYGAEAYGKMVGFLRDAPAGAAGAAGVAGAAAPTFAMMGYRLGGTLSEHGTVARAVCVVGGGGYLERIEELLALEKTAAGARQQAADGTVREFTGAEPVSMNFWGFTPAVFPLLESRLSAFLRAGGGSPKAECYIPVAVGELVAGGQARVRVLPTDSVWFGVTYRDDKPRVTELLGQLVGAGQYPAPLWA